MVKLKVTVSSFTNDNLKVFFMSREGWGLRTRRPTADLSKAPISQKTKDDLERCVDILADYKNKYQLSIIAGGLLYSKPRAKATSYSEVEIGLIKVGKGLIYLRKGAPYFDGDVEGYTNIDDFNKIIELIESGKVKEYEEGDK